MRRFPLRRILVLRLRAGGLETRLITVVQHDAWNMTKGLAIRMILRCRSSSPFLFKAEAHADKKEHTGFIAVPGLEPRRAVVARSH